MENARGLAARAAELSRELEENRASIRRIEARLRDVEEAIKLLAQEQRHARQLESAEREKLRLRLQHEVAKLKELPHHAAGKVDNRERVGLSLGNSPSLACWNPIGPSQESVIGTESSAHTDRTEQTASERNEKHDRPSRGSVADENQSVDSPAPSPQSKTLRS